ncbi:MULTISPECIES: peroxiredoxin family protein [unclassified Corallococcus]|uniref:peroxiredoxin family protein n=1 Tax=unclassified Corallococcus TaxID=2685029 RepID=UPI001A8EAF0D|nr:MULTISPECIES: TlpA disulfide reductase family protein [unclassified Corallococcus]MBN9687895.1 TlpA family protein disulfide reductase [Corallococcus sp. NCSPR001]WAS88292.1 TlpA disulfide reductase family protein [Corallococcus sp. NCRR]
MASTKIPLTLLDPDGGWVNAPVHVSELDGLPVLLHFWTMDCEDCAKQFEAVNQWVVDYGPKGLKVIGVDVTHNETELRDTNKVEGFAREHGLRYPIAMDDGSMAKAYGVDKHPAFLLFGTDGRLKNRIGGKDALRRVRALLKDLPGQESPALHGEVSREQEDQVAASNP